jgi:cytochrome c biogenesis protein CcmG/thiol:disulfide interchange protein DsbE
VLRRAGRLAAFAMAGWLALGPGSGLAAENMLLHKPAPAFARRDLGGKPVSLREYRGKVVLLNFWATWCGPCQVELPRFAAWQKQYGPAGLQVIAVSMDDGDGPVRALVGKLGVNYPVVMGDAALGERYGGVLGLPVTYLIARDGRIAVRYEGGTHLAEMEKRVEQLLAGR